MRDSVSNNDAYLTACRNATKDDSAFKEFKRNPAYRAILEHVNEEVGQRYLDSVEERSPELLELFPKFLENDLEGDPIVFNYAIGNTSPTTLRYIKVLADLKSLFGSLDNMDIIEIGAGYGGQSKIICEAYNISSYTYIDLPDVVKLIEKYTNKTLPNQPKEFIHSYEIKDNIKNSYDLVISNYAFSECVPKVQREYIDFILNKSKKGYLTCNFINHLFGLGSLTKEQLLEEINHKAVWDEETPNTFEGNIVITWGI